MSEIEYTVETRKSFDDAVRSIEERTAAKGFSVLHTHDVAATLSAKGFKREPLKIIEICNARYANDALAKDVHLALMLPCPVSVYTDGGKTFISTFRPSAMPRFFPQAGVETIAAEVEKAVFEIIAEAR